MLSIARTKELLKDKNLALTDKEAERIRDGFDVLAEIIFAKWREKREQNNDRDKNQN